MTGKDRLLQTLTDAVSKADADAVEILALAGRKELSRCANSVIHQNVSATDGVMAARVVRGRRVGSASVHGTTLEAASLAVAHALELARFVPEVPDFPGFPGPTPESRVDAFAPATAESTPLAKAAALGSVFTAAARHGLTVAGAYATNVQELAVVNSSGVAAYAPLTSASVNFIALGPDSSGYACGVTRDAGKLDVAALGERAIQKARDGSGPSAVEPGTYEVVLEPSALAELMEWMTYTCFGARSVHEKTSALAGNFGTRILSDRVTIYDDAAEDAGLPTPFDYEGQAKRRLNLVEKGVPRGYATDATWAARMNVPNTAHAVLRSGGDVDPVPMNLFLEAGDVPAAGLVSGVERGLLITRFHYVNGFLDTRRALMTGMTRDGTFLIENGKVGRSVGNLRFTQSMVEALGDVRGISREREAIPVWWSAAANTGALTMPTVHLGRFHFSGRTES
jgi:PmbA protein